MKKFNFAMHREIHRNQGCVGCFFLKFKRERIWNQSLLGSGALLSKQNSFSFAIDFPHRLFAYPNPSHRKRCYAFVSLLTTLIRNGDSWGISVENPDDKRSGVCTLRLEKRLTAQTVNWKRGKTRTLMSRCNNE